MTDTQISICQTCGHLFRSDTAQSQPTFNPERTQMLTLPPSVYQATPPQQTRQYEPISYIEPVSPHRHAKTPIVAILIGVLVLLATAFYWVIH